MHIRSLSFIHDTFPTTTSYPFSLDVFKKTERLAFHTPVTFFIGENGTGKSALLQAIARGPGIHIWEEHEGRRDTKNLHEYQLTSIVEHTVPAGNAAAERETIPLTPVSGPAGLQNAAGRCSLVR
jgi:predicted ATPase